MGALEKIYGPDSLFCDEFTCDVTENFHDAIYISPRYEEVGSPCYCLNRIGMVGRVPHGFAVKRKAQSKCSHIFCITAGKGTVDVDGNTYPMREGDVVLLPNQYAHEYKSDAADPLGMAWMEFFGSDTDRLMSYIVERLGFSLSGEIYPVMLRKIQELLDTMLANPGYHPSVEVYEVLFTLLRYKNRTDGNGVRSEISEKLTFVNEYIETHLHEKITNEELAAMMNYSPHYFLKLFNRLHGMTPGRYILHRRFSRAKYLLRYTDDSVDQVAQQVGFRYTSYFIRHFKQWEGVTPATYRKQNRMV
jgi:AraC-like DNA-binding protein